MAPRRAEQGGDWITGTGAGNLGNPNYEFGSSAQTYPFPENFVHNVAAQQLDPGPVVLPDYRWNNPNAALKYHSQEPLSLVSSHNSQWTANNHAVGSTVLLHDATSGLVDPTILRYGDISPNFRLSSVQRFSYGSEMAPVEQDPNPPRLCITAPTWSNDPRAGEPSPIGFSDNVSHYSGSTCASATSSVAFSAEFETPSVGFQSPSGSQMSASFPRGKRASPFGDNDSVDDTPSDAHSTGRTAKRPRRDASKDHSQEKQGPRFACPFHKDNPARNNKSSCTGPGFLTIDRLREHIINRVHDRQAACKICGRPCGSIKALRKHYADGKCNEDSSKIYPEQISREQKESLEEMFKRMRAKRGEEKWNELWRIVKPGKPLPSSPYHEQNPVTGKLIATQLIEALQELQRERMEDILTRIYESNPAGHRWEALLGALQGEIEHNYPEVRQRQSIATSVSDIDDASSPCVEKRKIGLSDGPLCSLFNDSPSCDVGISNSFAFALPPGTGGSESFEPYNERLLFERKSEPPFQWPSKKSIGSKLDQEEP